MKHANLKIHDLGTCAYEQALEFQNELHATVKRDGDSHIILVEHPKVLTMGKNASREHLLDTESSILKSGVNIVSTERGGEVTAHEPGQLVVYPILNLSLLKLTPKSYVCALEQSVINTLAEFGITAARDPINPGVWVGLAKICAIGIRIKERVTMHGLALNVANDLQAFSLINPCGITGRTVTSMSRIQEVPVAIEEVKPVLLAELLNNLGIQVS